MRELKQMQNLKEQWHVKKDFRISLDNLMSYNCVAKVCSWKCYYTIFNLYNSIFLFFVYILTLFEQRSMLTSWYAVKQNPTK